MLNVKTYSHKWRDAKLRFIVLLTVTIKIYLIYLILYLDY